MKLKNIITATLAATAMSASAATISVNFRENNANQLIASGTSAGLGSETNWNDGNGANGTVGSLVDSDGSTTTASVTWTSGGTWGDASANTDANAGVGDGQMARGYLDDGGAGADFTVTGITYASYQVVLYFATDTAGGIYRPVTINGSSFSTTGTKQQYGTQPNWDATNSLSTGTNLSGNLVVDSLARNGAERASLAGFQIIDTTPAPEPTSSVLLGLGGLALILRRRK